MANSKRKKLENKNWTTKNLNFKTNEETSEKSMRIKIVVQDENKQISKQLNYGNHHQKTNTNQSTEASKTKFCTIFQAINTEKNVFR